MPADKHNYISLSGFYVDATTGKFRYIQKDEQYKLKKIYHSEYFKPEKKD